MEAWRDVPGYTGYQVSDLGRLRSNRMTRGREWRLLSPSKNDKGYRETMLRVGGKSIHGQLHRLVAWAFHGPQPFGYHVNHKDGVKTNNRPDNLEYVTPWANHHHARLLGLIPKQEGMRGELNHMAVLTVQVVVMIREAYAAGTVTQVQLAEALGLRQGHISNIIRGRTWKHVGGPIATAHPRGEKNAAAKLTNADAEEIRKVYAHGEISQGFIARQYGVSQAVVGRIVRGLGYTSGTGTPKPLAVVFGPR